MREGADWVFKPAELNEFLADKGNNALLGIRYNAHTPDWIELAMPWDERFREDPATGALANGAIMTLMDNAAPNSTLIARSHCFRLTGSTALTRAIAYEDSPDEPTCHVTATFMLL
jgi:acyl-coenzyme A thioesterase PaaI-like protein